MQLSNMSSFKISKQIVQNLRGLLAFFFFILAFSKFTHRNFPPLIEPILSWCFVFLPVIHQNSTQKLQLLPSKSAYIYFGISELIAAIFSYSQTPFLQMFGLFLGSMSSLTHVAVWHVTCGNPDSGIERLSTQTWFSLLNHEQANFWNSIHIETEDVLLSFFVLFVSSVQFIAIFAEIIRKAKKDKAKQH